MLINHTYKGNGTQHPTVTASGETLSNKVAFPTINYLLMEVDRKFGKNSLEKSIYLTITNEMNVLDKPVMKYGVMINQFESVMSLIYLQNSSLVKIHNAKRLKIETAIKRLISNMFLSKEQRTTRGSRTITVYKILNLNSVEYKNVRASKSQKERAVSNQNAADQLQEMKDYTYINHNKRTDVFIVLMELDSKINDYASDVKRLKQRVNELERDVHFLQRENDSLNDRISEINCDIFDIEIATLQRMSKLERGCLV